MGAGGYIDPTGYLNDIQPETFDHDDDYSGGGGTGGSTGGGEMGSYNYSGPYSLYVSNPTLYGYIYGTETWMEHATYVAYVRSSMRDAYTYANSGYSMVHKRGTDNIGSAGEQTYQSRTWDFSDKHWHSKFDWGMPFAGGGNMANYMYTSIASNDEGKRTNGKGNDFRGGSQAQRDNDLWKYPKEFIEWYHKNTKDYKLPGQPDPDLAEPYQDWLDLGQPTSFSWESFKKSISIATGLTGTSLIIYIVISEGTRLIPLRNLILIP